MEVVTKTIFDPNKSCHVCSQTENRGQLVFVGNDGSVQGQAPSAEETSVYAGVFQETDRPGVYPNGLNLRQPNVEPWSGSVTSRWLPTGTGKCDSTQPRGTDPLPQDDEQLAKCEQRAVCLIRHLEALLIAISNLTRAKMASYIPEELTVDEIERLMVSPSDSDTATPLGSPDAEGIRYTE